MDKDEEFDALRARLTEVDSGIVDLIAKRQEIVSEIGRIKRAAGRPLRDFQREKIVLDSAAERARLKGLEPQLAQDVVRVLIDSSLANQERDFVAHAGDGGGRQVLIIGGSGAMGMWFVEHLVSQGFDVHIADPAAKPGPGKFMDWREAGTDYDVIVVATPIRTSAEIIGQLAEIRPSGLIFDIASLKSPLKDEISKAVDAGCKIASLHPMFGPETVMLSQHHLIFVDTGCPEATDEAKTLFAGTMVDQLDMSLDEHDHTIAFVLGLSHALNITFFDALQRSGEAARKLITMSSTTFDAQLLISAAVARENPDLYFEIQHLNNFGMESLLAMCESADHVRQLVEDGDRQGFRQIMRKGQDYFALRRRPPEEVRSGARRRRIGE